MQLWDIVTLVAAVGSRQREKDDLYDEQPKIKLLKKLMACR